MTVYDDPKAFLNAFEHLAGAVGWVESQWASVIIIQCLVRPAQQVVFYTMTLFRVR